MDRLHRDETALSTGHPLPASVRVVVMGVAGCGKSSLAAALARQEALPLIEGDDHHSDTSRRKMSAGVALDDADRESWLQQLGRALGASTGGAVLTCSALKRRYRDSLRDAAPGVRFIFLAIDRLAALERVTGRSAHFFSPALVDSQFAALEPPAGEAGVLCLDASLPLGQLLAEAAAWLRQPPATTETAP